MSPQRRAKRLPPTLRLAEKVKQTLLLSLVITTARGLYLNLAAQRDGMNRLIRVFRVGDTQLERKLRRSRVCYGLGSLYLKI
jgi:hypothetical protein